jgi:hypothetical protein
VVGLAVVWLTRFSVRVRQPIRIDIGDQREAPERHPSTERRRKTG